MRTILHLLVKELIQLRRDPKLFPILFVVPVFQLMILGYAANLDVRNIPTAVCDMDRTRESRDFVRLFPNSDYFTIERDLDTPDRIDALLDDGAVSMAIVIPKEFARKLAAGRQVEIQIIADGSDASYATRGLSYATQVVTDYSRSILVRRLSRLNPRASSPLRVQPEVRVWYNPELKSRNFMVPGVLGLLLMVVTMLLTSLAIVKEKEIGTLEQLIVTPIKPYQLILGKLLPFAGIGLIEALVAITVATLWFGIPLRGSLVLLISLSMVFLLTTLGLGLFISTISKTQQQAMMTAAFFIMMPMMFLSGFVFPIENMPRLIQWITYLLPLRYFFTIIRGIFLKGVGLPELWGQALTMLFLGIAILALSALRFQKKLG